jgi:hypothetical protein
VRGLLRQDKLFACIWAVNFSGIKERDAFVVGGPNELNAFGFGCWGAVVGADTHAPERGRQGRGTRRSAAEEPETPGLPGYLVLELKTPGNRYLTTSWRRR